MHTNSYMEAWHQLLKSWYIPPPEKQRNNEVVKIFGDKVELAYKNQVSQVEGGFQAQGVSSFQSPQKMNAEEYTPDFLEFFGVVIYSCPEHVSQTEYH